MRRHTIMAIGCAFLGHDDMVHGAAGRLFLRCERCRRETGGWTIEPATHTPFRPGRRPHLAVIRRREGDISVRRTATRAA